MRYKWMAVFVSVAATMTIAPSRAAAQEVTQAGAAKAATADVSVGTGVENRELTGAAESFPSGTQKLYCYSRLENADSTEIEHVWYKGDAEQARVKLKVNGSPWRTYSSKTLGPDASGTWRCDVVLNGQVLKSVTFKVE